MIAIPIEKKECGEEVQCASSETLSSVEDRSGCEVNEYKKFNLHFKKKKIRKDLVASCVENSNIFFFFFF